MAKIKSVTLSSEPAWHNTRTIEAERDQIEINLEGGMVHFRVNHPRIQMRIGKHVMLAPSAWAYVTFEDEPAALAKDAKK